MKSLSKVVLVVVLAVAPVASFAQSASSLSRAQVRAQLVQVESAGYDLRDGLHYPQNIQAAEAKVEAQNAAAKDAASAYGGEVDGTSRSGHAGGF
ncbi:DUF4148 domain-containing protein [Paraburkholderia susongensis]|uniref:DUF4148 domain-containing protein n=1 Tax=Paraburkholderia susongensis TaxID=1515439 RepID=A0A1X7J6R3_9BURK|nr:DUF4148 domain-containing protein [Paraburkholderia susongensis]SMG23375.1 protein of unknown function [Paraburkholderia susongensis]